MTWQRSNLIHGRMFRNLICPGPLKFRHTVHLRQVRRWLKPVVS